MFEIFIVMRLLNLEALTVVFKLEVLFLVAFVAIFGN